MHINVATWSTHAVSSLHKFGPQAQLLRPLALKMRTCIETLRECFRLLLFSEYPLGTKPNRANYVQRNRIQSGLSCAVIIVEAAANSGTMETARHCEKQGRNLYAITPDTFDANTDVSGNRELIERGVNALGSKDDIQNLIQKLDDVAGNYRLL